MTKPKGFAWMAIHNPARMREIATKGGRASHTKGTGHEFDSSEAREAGRKGGKGVVAKLGSKHMAEIGRKGGTAAKAARILAAVAIVLLAVGCNSTTEPKAKPAAPCVVSIEITLGQPQAANDTIVVNCPRGSIR